MSQMENILFPLGKIDPKFRLYIKKISRKATSLSKSHLGKKIKGRSTRQVLKWAVCGLNYQAQFILLNQIQAVLGNPIQLGL